MSLTTTVHSNVNDTIKYNHKYLDIGDGYNLTTGIYTAPQSGTYSLSWTTAVRGDGWMSTSLMINNVSHGIQWADNQLSGSPYIDVLNPTSNVVVQLNIGDQVYVKVIRQRNTNLYYSPQDTGSSFSGLMNS